MIPSADKLHEIMASSECHRYNESSCRVLKSLVELSNLQHVGKSTKSLRRADSSAGSSLLLEKLHLAVVLFIFSLCN